MTPEHARLVDALIPIVAGGRPEADFDSIREIASAAARSNGYLDDEADERHAGRTLSGDVLDRLGLPALLRSRQELNPKALAEQLAGYLAGPPEPLLHYAVLDVDWELPRPVELGGWLLSRPTAAEWNGLRPVPLAADHAPAQVWDPLLAFGEHLVLTAPDPTAKPVRGIWFHFLRCPSRDKAWEPLLAFNLWRNDPVEVLARYTVERGRAVDRLYGSLPSTYAGPGGEHEVPALGPLYVDEAHGEQLIRFLTEITTRLDPGTLTASFYKTVRRSALRFLDTADKVGFDTDVTFADDKPQVVLDYVTALENLLADGDHGELTRKITQRAAVLIGRNDDDRLTVRQQVKNAYGVRSSIAHGGEPSEKKLTEAVTQMRSILRKVFIVAIVL